MWPLLVGGRLCLSLPSWLPSGPVMGKTRVAQVAETMGCPKQTPGKPNPKGHTKTQRVKDLRQEWPSSHQALRTSSFGVQGCNCGTANLKYCPPCAQSPGWQMHGTRGQTRVPAV